MRLFCDSVPLLSVLGDTDSQLLELIISFKSILVCFGGDELNLFDGRGTKPELRMTGPMDEIYLDEGKFLQPAGIKRPYFTSGKFMTLEMLSNDDGYESSGFQLTATSVKKGI